MILVSDSGTPGAADSVATAADADSPVHPELNSQYDFVVCGSGSSGSVVASRLSENPDASVLLLEVGGGDDHPAVLQAGMWLSNLGSNRDWSFRDEPNPHLNGRSIPMSMGRVLGGGSSINVMAWARGHRADWEFFAAEAGDSAWNYESVLGIYHRIEDWHGPADPDYRGSGGPVYVAPAEDPNPIAPAMVDAAHAIGIPSFEHQNGRMMEVESGAAIADLIVRGGIRQSIFRSYVHPYRGRANLTILTGALVTRLVLDRGRVTGVIFDRDGKSFSVRADSEVVLSLGAIHTPKVLMQSGIGDETELMQHGIHVAQHLPGVGRNLQDHPGFDCVWEYEEPLPPRNNGGEATFFWTSDSRLDAPDVQTCQIEAPRITAENAARFNLPAAGWTLLPGVVRPKSRGHIRLTGPNPTDAVEIHANMLSHPDDLAAAISAVELSREIGNSPQLRRFTKREAVPGPLKGVDLERFIRDAAWSYSHQTCTAKMGRDSMSVVDGTLKVYGIDSLRIADGSIMPRVTTGNTMAPCVVIGERASEIIRAQYKL